ncbi:hypothetical protein FHS11_001229 [Mucilaginibacter gotjawali]|uniref:Uncharacterized protein n=1 Tax=Mucilaginibacter gotjawali TaxID=1550579 RepID=A0A839SDU0_9SPHI|nr:hypothetical protein [Mucilaginibacter gotjawali]
MSWDRFFYKILTDKKFAYFKHLFYIKSNFNLLG